MTWLEVGCPEERKMLIHWNWEPKYTPVGWSYGYCPACEQEGALRLEDVTDVCYINGLIPLTEKFREEIARCDFCGRRVGGAADLDGIDRKDWSPQEGMPALLSRLGLSARVAPPQPPSDARLRALLASVEKGCSSAGHALGPGGAVAGGVAGALLCIPLGMWLHGEQLVKTTLDAPGFVFMLCLFGAILGVALGATGEFFLRRGRGAAARIEAVHAKYPMDLYRLEELSWAYSKPVRKAVKEVWRKAALAPEVKPPGAQPPRG